MLAKISRFHGQNSLNWAYRKGQTVRDPRLSLRYALNSRREHFRAAVVVSRKVNKSAVVRNRIRRRIYSVIEELSGKINLNYDLIFSVYSDELAGISQEELKDLIGDLLKKANVLPG
jgi:ribonuclease P protein component